MNHLTTEEAAAIYRISPHQLRRKSAADPTRAPGGQDAR